MRKRDQLRGHVLTITPVEKALTIRLLETASRDEYRAGPGWQLFCRHLFLLCSREGVDHNDIDSRLWCYGVRGEPGHYETGLKFWAVHPTHV